MCWQQAGDTPLTWAHGWPENLQAVKPARAGLKETAEVKAGMTAFVLFGLGSAFVVEVVESCTRSGHTIAAGVANHKAPGFLPRHIRTIEVAEITRDLIALPCLCPLFTPGNRFSAAREARQLGLRF